MSKKGVNSVPTSQIDFSVIMPTFNSAKTILKALDSIRNQNYLQTAIEILVIDGGSSDQTLEIAKQYNCIILNNPLKNPEEAKKIGIQEAKGLYLVFQDSDEEVLDQESFQTRAEIFKKNPRLQHLVTRGLRVPDGYSDFAYYMNSVGDPFNYSLLHQDGADLYLSYKSRLITQSENKNSIVLVFSNSQGTPILDACGHTIRAEKDSKKQNFNYLFFTSMRKNSQFAILKDSYTNHYSNATFLSILKKILFRIKSNLTKKPTAGYVNRGEAGTNKHIFIIYALSIVWPLYDGIVLATRYKKMIFLLHPLFTLFTFAMIVWAIIFYKEHSSVLEYG